MTIATPLLALSAITAIAIAVAYPAAAQPLKDQVVGSWVLSDLRADTWDVDDRNPLGADVQGRMILAANGMATVVILGGDRKPFTTLDRLTGTPEENQAAAQGTQAFYGTYTVDERNHTVAPADDPGCVKNESSDSPAAIRESYLPLC